MLVVWECETPASALRTLRRQLRRRFQTASPRERPKRSSVKARVMSTTTRTTLRPQPMDKGGRVEHRRLAERRPPICGSTGGPSTPAGQVQGARIAAPAGVERAWGGRRSGRPPSRTTASIPRPRVRHEQSVWRLLESSGHREGELPAGPATHPTATHPPPKPGGSPP